MFAEDYGAQVFEAVGLQSDFVDAYFRGTTSRIEGIGLDALETDLRERHRQAFEADGAEATLEQHALVSVERSALLLKSIAAFGFAQCELHLQLIELLAELLGPLAFAHLAQLALGFLHRLLKSRFLLFEEVARFMLLFFQKMFDLVQLLLQFVEVGTHRFSGFKSG